MERNLILNRWKTSDGTILISRHVHGYVSHDDKNGEYYFIDGGNDYIRMSVNEEKMTDMCIYDDAPINEIRRNLCRGTFDENNKSIWIPLCNMSNQHIENCITYYADWFDENGCNNRYMKYYLLELLVRWDAKFYIIDKKYTNEDIIPQIDSVSNNFHLEMNDNLNLGVVESVIKFEDNIKKGLHTDTKETMEIIYHLYKLLNGRKEVMS